MKTLFRTFVLLALVSVLGDTRVWAGATDGTYKGTAYTSHAYYDVLSGKFYLTLSFQRPIVVIIAPPQRSLPSGTIENNPLSLTVSPKAKSSGTFSGDLYLRSAVRVYPDTSSEFLIRFWKLKNTNDGFTGKLTDSGSSYGLNLQSVYGQALLVPGRPDLGSFQAPFSFYDARLGTSYRARLTAVQQDKSLNLQLQGFASAFGSTMIYNTTTIVARRR